MHNKISSCVSYVWVIKQFCSYKKIYKYKCVCTFTCCIIKGSRHFPQRCSLVLAVVVHCGCSWLLTTTMSVIIFHLTSHRWQHPSYTGAANANGPSTRPRLALECSVDGYSSSPSRPRALPGRNRASWPFYDAPNFWP